MPAPTDRFSIRPAVDDDLEEIVSVCAAALSWTSPTFDRELFRWKHIENAFGRSLMLVATDTELDGQIVAVRTFMRWRFATRDGTTVAAARAVDTATLPAAQGNGLFRRLTLAGLDQLESSGCGFVFNTPNDKSLPGYLNMGWFEAGSVPFGFAAARPSALLRAARARTAAHKPSLDTPTLGVAAQDAFEEPPLLPTPGNAELWTDHSHDTLRWRYCGGPVAYRIVQVDHDGSLVVRVRQRGPIRELLVADVLGAPAPGAIRRAIREARRLGDADIVVAAAGSPTTLRLERLGPRLALRTISRPVSGEHFSFPPGDIELF